MFIAEIIFFLKFFIFNKKIFAAANEAKQSSFVLLGKENALIRRRDHRNDAKFFLCLGILLVRCVMLLKIDRVFTRNISRDSARYFFA